MVGTIKSVNTVLGTIYQKCDSEGKVIQRAGSIGYIKKIELSDEDNLYKYLKGFDNTIYFIITDLFGAIRLEPTRYLNVTLRNHSYKKRELAFSALKLFYSFIELYNIQDYNIDLKQKDLNKLLGFLKGGTQRGVLWDIELDTMRSNKTINTYFSVYRNYYEELSNKPHTIFHKNIKAGTYAYRFKQDSKIHDRYQSNMKVTITITPPKYIKEEEYFKILDLIEIEYSIRDQIIIKLMYEYGLRLGEVLGLTIEDLEEGPGENHKLMIRNRATDKPWQSAKSVMNIYNSNDYKTKEYRMEGNFMGYQSVIIDSETMELIQEYLDQTRDELLLNSSPKKMRNLETKSKADKVTDRVDLISNENQYIFLSHQHFSPITASGWNNVLHEMLDRIGIQTDKEKGHRENNLSHRFRHGFAMRCMRLGFSQEELRTLLRHANIESVSRYFNPDEEERAELLRKTKMHSLRVKE